MVLVGLGVDERARRIVQFLSTSGLEIDLVTFNAFKHGEHLFLARQVEISSPPVRYPRSRGETRDERLRILMESAQSRGVEDLLENVRRFIYERIPDAYQYPGKTAYSFSLSETTDNGTESARAYIAVYLHPRKENSLLIRLTPRAAEAAGDAVQDFRSSVSEATDAKHGDFEIEAPVTAQSWPDVSKSLGPLVESMVRGWKVKTGRLDA